MSLDISADLTSCKSLSFTGLVCIQNQHLTPQRGYASSLPHARKASQEFEFSHATAASTITVPRNNYSAETLFSKGRLQPHVTPFGTRPVEQNSSKWVIPPVQSKNSRSELTESTSDKCTRKPNAEVRNRTDQKHTCGRQGFGQRIFKSFTTPCRDCRTLKSTPSTREQLQ